MGNIKTINLDEESLKIWKKIFKDSQKFSGWVCNKLKEEGLQTMDIEQKREYLEKEKAEAKEKLESLDAMETELQIKEKSEKKEVKEKKKTDEELKKKKLEKEEVVKKNFFDVARNEYNLNDKKIEKLFEEFKKQDLAIYDFLNKKKENEK